MPYIHTPARERLVKSLPQNAGELNYYISVLLNHYWQRTGDYQGINDIVGALEGAKMEFYARVARPYEDKKKEANGDVYNV